jgi:hypothetical protein
VMREGTHHGVAADAGMPCICCNSDPDPNASYRDGRRRLTSTGK